MFKSKDTKRLEWLFQRLYYPKFKRNGTYQIGTCPPQKTIRNALMLQ